MNILTKMWKNYLGKKLILAIEKENFQQAESLIRKGANVNATDNNDRKPLFAALDKENFRIVQSLLESGADVNAKDFLGATPLLIAAKKNNLQNVKELIRSGADLDVIGGSDRFAALHHAVLNNNLKMVKVLLEAGADLLVKENIFQCTPLDIAETPNRNVQAKIATLLREKGNYVGRTRHIYGAIMFSTNKCIPYTTTTNKKRLLSANKNHAKNKKVVFKK